MERFSMREVLKEKYGNQFTWEELRLFNVSL